MSEFIWLKLFLTILSLVHLQQALSFWEGSNAQIIALSVVIEGIRMVIANSETCLIRGRSNYEQLFYKE